uniref:Rho guanine nucleotide exchange factor 3 n=1 Tax=Laticauda laticaudata TaxID=8630 RepID=A0A8C5ST15_LATLA
MEALPGDRPVHQEDVEEAVGGQQPSIRTSTSAFVARRDRRRTARDLQNDLQQATNVHVAAQMVRNRLHEGGMRVLCFGGCGGCTYSPTPWQDVWHLPENTKIGKFTIVYMITNKSLNICLLYGFSVFSQAYHDPMLKLSIMSEEELNQIFGTLDSLIPLHEDLLKRLKEIRKSDGSTESVGHILVSWLPFLNAYDSYCSNQVAAKALLDHKKQDHRVQDFLQRCLESPFSRKLDLWNFLDIPRSRLVKYPLLLREILKHTPNDHPDHQHLEEAMNIVQGIVAEINKKTGESECQYYKERLIYLDDTQRDSLIDESRVVCCHGELKNNRGAKFHVFLFQEVLVITRAIFHNEQLCYQMYRQPIPVKDLTLEDLQDGEVRLGGSIRGAFSNNERIKNFFRISFKNGSQSQSYSLQANDTFNKQLWLNSIRQAKELILRASGENGVLDLEGPVITSSRNRIFQQESKSEQMDQSDSGSNCSMDTSEISLECDHMEETDSWENDRELESNV